MERRTRGSTVSLGAKASCMFMDCYVVTSNAIDNPYCSILNHICSHQTFVKRPVSCKPTCDDRHGRGPSPRRGLRLFPGVGKCLVRAASAGGSSGGGGARAERALARHSSLPRVARWVSRDESHRGSPIDPRCGSRCETACETHCDAHGTVVRARAVPARALRVALPVRRARLRRARPPSFDHGRSEWSLRWAHEPALVRSRQ